MRKISFETNWTLLLRLEDLLCALVVVGQRARHLDKKKKPFFWGGRATLQRYYYITHYTAARVEIKRFSRLKPRGIISDFIFIAILVYYILRCTEIPHIPAPLATDFIM